MRLPAAVMFAAFGSSKTELSWRWDRDPPIYFPGERAVLQVMLSVKSGKSMRISIFAL